MQPGAAEVGSRRICVALETGWPCRADRGSPRAGSSGAPRVRSLDRTRGRIEEADRLVGRAGRHRSRAQGSTGRRWPPPPRTAPRSARVPADLPTGRGADTPRRGWSLQRRAQDHGSAGRSPGPSRSPAPLHGHESSPRAAHALEGPGDCARSEAEASLQVLRSRSARTSAKARCSSPSTSRSEPMVCSTSARGGRGRVCRRGLRALSVAPSGFPVGGCRAFGR